MIVQPTQTAFAKQRQRFVWAYWLVRIFYLVLLLRCLTWVANSWPLWVELTTLRPIWPVQWIAADSIGSAITLIDLLLVGSAFVAALWPGQRFARLAVFLAFFQFTAFANSFGKINHGFHMWIAISFCLILLPQGDLKRLEGSISKRQQYLTVIAALQILIMVFYTLSGGLKLLAAIEQISLGSVHLFHPYALAYQVAYRLSQTNTQTLLGHVFIAYPLLGWPLYVLTAYLEATAVVAAFRPHLHRVWGVGLAAMHLGIWLVMGIPFFENIFAVLLFLWYSPFTPANQHWKQVVRELPGLKWFFARRSQQSMQTHLTSF